MADPAVNGPVSRELIITLQECRGADPAVIHWPDDTFTVEADAQVALARGGRILVPRRGAVTDGDLHQDPARVAAFANGKLAGRAHRYRKLDAGYWVEGEPVPTYET